MIKRVRETISALVLRAKDRAAGAFLRAAAAIDKGFAHKAIALIDSRSPEALRLFVTERANEMSTKILMSIQDREGIAHCALCPQQFEIRKVGRRYACLNHTEEVKAKAA